MDTTVQERNITFLTDVKLLTRIIEGCRRITNKEGVQLRRSFRRTLTKLRLKRMKMAQTAKKLRTMDGAMIRELHRKLPSEAFARHQELLGLFKRVNDQK